MEYHVLMPAFHVQVPAVLGCTPRAEVAVPLYGSAAFSVLSFVPQLTVECTPRQYEVTPRLHISCARQKPNSYTEVLSVGGRKFKRSGKLGQGSFAVVWEAYEVCNGGSGTAEHGASALALKCSRPATPQLREACLFEAEVLRRLAMALPPKATNRVPKYIAHETYHEAATPGVSGGPSTTEKVLLVMSKLEGKPLDEWLYGTTCPNQLKGMSMAALLDGPLPGGQIATCDLASAGAVGAAFMSQMAPVMAALTSIAYHRDISAHNFLVQQTTQGMQFSILDFGLAVRSSSWTADYKKMNICGDPRYFTPAAWMLMVYGHEYITANMDNSLLQQYLKRIDHFSFGVLMLEVFFGLWKGPDVDTKRCVIEAWLAWRGYWSDAVALFQAYHAEGPEALRHKMARSSATTVQVQRLRHLCRALRAAAPVVASTSPAVSAIFRAAAEFVDPAGTLDWVDLPAVLNGKLGKKTSVIETRWRPARCDAGHGASPVELKWPRGSTPPARGLVNPRDWRILDREDSAGHSRL